jgi:hypothetical protein
VASGQRALAGRACGGGPDDSLARVTAAKIRHLTDVSHCKLHQYLCCNGRFKCLAALAGSPRAGRPKRVVPSRTGLISPVRNSRWTRWRSPVRPRRANCASR